MCMFLDLVLLDKKSAAEIRTTLRTMLTDSDRRQALIQELIKTNNRLKWATLFSKLHICHTLDGFMYLKSHYLFLNIVQMSGYFIHPDI